MTDPENDPPRLSDVLYGDGFPDLGPRTDLSDAVTADGLDRLREASVSAAEFSAGMQETCERLKKQAQTGRRVASEIRAAHDDPDWLGHS